MTVIDVHTHMLTRQYLDYLEDKGRGTFQFRPTTSGLPVILRDDIPFFTLMPEMFDYDLRIRDMDQAGVDVAIVSLTCPNVFFGDETVSCQAARMINDSMAEQSRLRPDRIRWFASIPWQYPSAAITELARARQLGAIGVFVTANIESYTLTAPRFAPVWAEIDRLALPVLVHPTTPAGSKDMQLQEYGLVPPVGFMFDTTLAISRMILDGFFDRFRQVKIIAAHGGGALPYIIGRLDRAHEVIPACAATIRNRPSSYLHRIFFDSVVYAQAALDLCIEVASDDNVVYGSDYPHNLGDMRGCLQRVDALPTASARKIRGTNALRLFDL
jgi:aminocarboxymuconate-semialdehyde decarboxylase